jgi:hypothetical protein
MGTQNTIAKRALSLQPRWPELEQVLLSIGGVRVAVRDEVDLEWLLAHGQLRDRPVLRVQGVTRECHRNASLLYRHNPESVQIETGWALSGDGVWRQHSWAVRDGLILETTVPRVRYFGITLMAEQAEHFARVHVKF